ncbi:MAG TPA: ABC transporter substrate-binding protein, partial [Gammaproteobacteria bacterium]|nr:ABC transporter substrate-binding protein [Gammaproteobacteria bacterium]
MTFGLGLAASAHAAPDGVIKLGYSGPLSGGGALFGKNHVTGLEMAIKELNDQGVEVAGKQYKVELIAIDDKYAPSEAGINARRLIQEHKTPVIFAGHTGGTFAMQSFNEQNNFLVVSYTSVPTVLERGNTLTVRTPPSFHGYLEPFIRTSMERFGKKAALVPGNHDYAKIWTQAFVPAWTAAGGQVVADNSLDYNKDTDFYSGVSRVLAAKPDVLFIGGASEPTALVVKQARELGFKG